MNDVLSGGDFRKFTVIKNGDIRKYLTLEEKAQLMRLTAIINSGRIREGKRASNLYLVINTDEPYIKEVTEILKQNGHWG